MKVAHNTSTECGLAAYKRVATTNGCDVSAAGSSAVEPRLRGSRDNSLLHEGWTAGIFISLAATIVVAPMLLLGAVSGRDFPFHLASWMEVAKQWHQGTIYPQWAEFANWGLGEPRFVFYPPGSWMLGAALGSVLPWKTVPILFVWLVLVGAGISMFLLGREYLAPKQATLAAMLFAANPYHLLLVYYRSDFAELLASAFFPLLLWGVMRTAREGWRRVPILALVLALIWLSNAPAAVIAVYSLVFLIMVAYLAQRDGRLLMYGLAAIAGGFGLAAFYIVPAARERAWVQINQVLSDGLRPEQNFLFTRATSSAVNTDFNIKISMVVLLMGLVTAAAAFYIAKLHILPRLPYVLAAGLAVVSLFMMFPLSGLLWRLTPELHFVQFPWRWAVPFSLAFSFLLGAAVGKIRKLAVVAAGVFIISGPLAKIVLAIEKPSSWRKAEISHLQQNMNNEVGYPGTPEYLPNGCSIDGLSESAAGEVGKGPDGMWVSQMGLRTFRALSKEPQKITLNLFDYPRWQVESDGSRIASKLQDAEGRIIVPVPPGDHVIHMVFRRDWDAKVGSGISIATAIMLSLLALRSWRKDKRQGTGPNQFDNERLPTPRARDSELLDAALPPTV